MFTLTMSTRGQFVLPKEVRDKLKLFPGCKVEGTVDEQGRIVLRPKLLTAREFVNRPRPPVKRVATVEEMDEGIGRAVAERDRRSKR